MSTPNLHNMGALAKIKKLYGTAEREGIEIDKRDLSIEIRSEWAVSEAWTKRNIDDVEQFYIRHKNLNTKVEVVDDKDKQDD
jgi:hypothetical protein